MSEGLIDELKRADMQFQDHALSWNSEKLTEFQFEDVKVNVFRFNDQNERFFLKRFVEEGSVDQDAGPARSGAERELMSYQRLQDAGFQTIKPAAVYAYPAHNTPAGSLFLSYDFLQGRPDILLGADYVIRYPERKREFFVRYTALINHLIARGFVHLDIHLDNFFTDGQQFWLVDVEHIRINPGLRFVHHIYFRIAENIVFDKEKLRLDEGDIQYFIDQLIKQGAYRKRSILWALRFWHALRLPSRMANLLKRNAQQKSIIQLFRLPSFLRFYAQ